MKTANHLQIERDGNETFQQMKLSGLDRVGAGVELGAKRGVCNVEY